MDNFLSSKGESPKKLKNHWVRQTMLMEIDLKRLDAETTAICDLTKH